MSSIESEIERMVLEQMPKELVISMNEDKDIKTLIFSILEFVKGNNDRLKRIQYKLHEIENEVSQTREEQMYRYRG